MLPAARGVLLERLGRRAEAIDALEAATALAPDARLPAALLGGVLARSNRLHEAEAALRRASELDPDNLHAARRARRCCSACTRHAQARAELLASIERNGERVNELCNLANATVCLGLQDEAVDLARRAIELAPDAAGPRRALCNTLPYRDGITGAELLGGTQGLLRPAAAREPAPVRQHARSRSSARDRSAVGLVEDASGRLADGRRVRDAGSRSVRRRLPGAERIA